MLLFTVFSFFFFQEECMPILDGSNGNPAQVTMEFGDVISELTDFEGRGNKAEFLCQAAHLPRPLFSILDWSAVFRHFAEQYI